MNRCVLAASLFALVTLLSGCGVKQALHTAVLEALAEAQGDAARLKEELKAEQAATDSAARDQARSEDEATAQSVLDQLRVPLEQPLAAGRLELRLREGRPVIDLPQDLQDMLVGFAAVAIRGALFAFSNSVWPGALA